MSIYIGCPYEGNHASLFVNASTLMRFVINNNFASPQHKEQQQAHIHSRQHGSHLLQDTTPVYIQITDNCPCITYDWATGAPVLSGVIPLFCTNVTHFQMDYQAFEQLAHPDYGLLNLRFRLASTIQQYWHYELATDMYDIDLVSPQH